MSYVYKRMIFCVSLYRVLYNRHAEEKTRKNEDPTAEILGEQNYKFNEC